MSDTVFRTAQEPDTNVAQSEPTKPAEEVLTPRTPEHHDLFATYYDAKGIPLTAEYLGIENIWNESKELKPSKSTSKIKY
jgi:hypothetical protein